MSDKVSKWTSWTLVLSKLTSEDSGSYTCRASNAFGKNEFNIQLEITGTSLDEFVCTYARLISVAIVLSC